MPRKLQVGGSCDCWCTKCKLTLEHTIIAMVEDKPKRVECTTCNSQHNYRSAPASAKKKTATAKKTATTKKTAATKKKATRTRSRAKKYQTLIAEMDASEAKRYQIDGTFEAKELIDHSRFGLGIVMDAIPGKKIQVLFEDGERLLVHER